MLMSFDIFFQCLENGDNGEFPVALFERGFRPFAEHWDADHVFLKYPDGGMGEIYAETAGETMNGFMISHAPAHPEFWQALFELLRETSSCLFWPGGGQVIARSSTRDHPAPDMIEALGEPSLVSSPQQIIDAMELQFATAESYRRSIVEGGRG